MKTTIHLVRHAEVENPDNAWYGHLEGYVLSERGRRQAEALAEHFAPRPIVAVYSSPLTRAIETASPIADRHGLEVVQEPAIIESRTRLEGRPADARILLDPRNWRYFINPFLPTWGERYESIAARMLEAVERMRRAHDGAEIAAVSHMTPIAVARLRLEGDTRPPWLASIPLERASVTTLVFGHSARPEIDYTEVGTAVT